jgi:hypothetical protein
MKKADRRISKSLTISGTSVYLVKKLSMIPASTKIGEIPSINFKDLIADN